MKLNQQTINKIDEVSDAAKKYDFVLVVDIAEGNPNGDPNQDNRPRLDEETGQGLISDVCIKRKIRDYVDVVHAGEPGRAIYVLNRDQFLEDVNNDLVKKCERDSRFLAQFQDPYRKDKQGKQKGLKHATLSAFACREYYDWRCFGAVPGRSGDDSEIDQATVRGPVQFQWGRSIDPIYYQEHGIGRVVQNRPRGEKQGQEVHGTFGAKFTVRYAAYRLAGHYSPFLAQRTGFTNDDLKLFWEALINWPCIDSSAARPCMGVRLLGVFRHEHPFGDAPAHELLPQVVIPALGSDGARSWDEYKGNKQVPSNADLPEGVTFHLLVG